MSYCDWDKTSDANKHYHDEEWGVPVFNDDRHQFEHLSMEVMQCGLSWDLMINRRDIFRKCFDNFEYEKIAKYDEEDIIRIMSTPNMIKCPLLPEGPGGIRKFLRLFMAEYRRKNNFVR